MENGLTSQLTPTVVGNPAPVFPHLSERGKIDLQQHRHDHQPDQHGDRQIDLRDRRRAERMKHAGHGLPEDDADDDAERDPERQDSARTCPWTGLCRRMASGGYRFAHGVGLAIAIALTVHDRLAVFLGERAALRIGKHVQHGLGGAAQLDAAAA